MSDKKEDDLPALFRLAKNISKHSDYKIKMGAVLVKNGRPISVGFNKIKYFGKWYIPPKATLHAEMDAIRTCGKDHIKGSEIYVYRAHKDGTLAMAKPCEHCEKVLREFGIKRVYYTTDNGYKIYNL